MNTLANEEKGLRASPIPLLLFRPGNEAVDNGFFLGGDLVTESHWNQFSLEQGTSRSHDRKGPDNKTCCSMRFSEQLKSYC